MKSVFTLMRRKAALLVAIVLMAGLYWMMRQPTLSETETSALASQFRFTRFPLPELPGYPYKSVRAVHPSLERISAWISSVGAAVALADLDGDGLPNDLCHVDPRNDQVTIAPVPGTGERYPPFALNPAPLPYDPATMAPMGCVPGDFNEDGLTDVLVYYWGRTPVVFLQRRLASATGPLGPAHFVPVDIVPGGERWFTNAATVADLDGDGHMDLIIANYFQDGAHILDAKGTGVEEMHNTKSKAFNGGRKHLLLWTGASSGDQPTVQFKEQFGVLDEAVDRSWTLAVGAADLDGDLLPEIYFANDFGPDRLLHNLSTPGHLRFALLEGKGDLNTPKSFVLGHDSFKGMGVDFGDLNGDGIPDIYVSNIADEYALQESHFLWLSTGDVQSMQEGVAPYVQASERLGLSRSSWGWDTKLADFNNNGVLEAVQATGFVQGTVNRWPELQSLGTGNNEMMSDPRHWPRFRPGDELSGHPLIGFFVRASDGRYYNLARQVGMDIPMVSRGIAVADVDGNGALSMVVANQWEPSYFFHNDCPNCGAFLGLHLLLADQQTLVRERTGHPGADTPGCPAVGTQATVYLPDGRKLVAQVDGGNGHSGKRSPDLHFGLGKLADKDIRLKVVLHWRGMNGKIHEQTLELTPGWHTIQLG